MFMQKIYIWVLICVFFVCPSSAESAGISTALGQVAKFLDQVLSLQQIDDLLSVAHGAQHATQRRHCGLPFE